MEPRTAAVERRTKETAIRATLGIDGDGRISVRTGVGFFDHLLTSFATHAFFDLDLTAEGDTHVDDHHTVEDVGIVLGQAFGRTLGDYGGLCRFGHAFVPMDEALALAAVDISRRPFLVFDAPSPLGKIGTFDCQLVEEFWRAFTNNAMITLHLKIMHGRNLHHLFEAMFKAAGRALNQASRAEGRVREALSTKGVI